MGKAHRNGGAAAVIRRRATTSQPLNRLKAALLILAFAIQGYIGAAHFHDLPPPQQASATAGPTFVAKAAAPSSRSSVDQPANLPDERNDGCDICHLIGIGALSDLPFIPPLPTPLFTAFRFSNFYKTPTVVARLSAHAPRGPPAAFVQA